MSDIYGVYCRNTGADMEFVDKVSGQVVFAFRNAANNQFVQSVADKLTAHAGASQTGALLLAAAFNRFTTVVTGNDSAILPPSLAGLDMVVINAHASNSMNVYAQVGETINALSANTAFAVAANKVCTFYCVTAGQWHTQLTA